MGRRSANILETVGNTPVVRINKLGPAEIDLYVKVEAFNPLGSVKDRLALGVIEEAEKSGKLKPGQTVIEATSGNTGIGLAMVCAQKGHPLVVTMAETFSIERRKLMRYLGARVVLTPASARAVGMVAKTIELAEAHGWFYTRQFENEANADMHSRTTAASGNPPLTSEGARLQPGHKPERDDVASAAEGKLPQAPRFDSHDTVGAVALDSYGNLAAATSTGGTLNKAPGRVGDSSLIGCGCYADNLSAAVSLTGWGEPIMKLVLGKWAVDRVQRGSAPEQAAQEAIAYLYKRLQGHGGIILLGPDGRFGLAHNTPRMAWGLANADGLRTGLSSEELT